jgi:hypothetical protein
MNEQEYYYEDQRFDDAVGEAVTFHLSEVRADFFAEYPHKLLEFKTYCDKSGDMNNPDHITNFLAQCTEWKEFKDDWGREYVFNVGGR